MFEFAGSFAQKGRIKAEKIIQKKIDHIASWAASNDYDIKYDSLEKANKDLSNYLLSITKSNPESIRWKFNIKELTIATSPDSLLRIYSWDTQTGGTMHFYKNMIQYKAGDKVGAIDINNSRDATDPGAFYKVIYLLQSNNQTYYLANYLGIGSSSDRDEGLRVFSVQNNQLVTNIKLIRTQSGLHNSIDYWYNFFSIVDWKVRPSILYDTVKKEIKIPLVDEKGTVTKRFITYKLTGKYFEKVKS